MTGTKKVAALALVLLLLVGLQGLWAGGGQAKPTVKEISFLTWNLPHYEDAIMGWVADFEAEFPNAKAKWIDRKGSELPTYFQTQLAAGTAPDIIEIQSVLWYEYADEGILMPLTPYLSKEPAIKDRFTPSFFEAASRFGDDYYLLPTYTPSSLLFMNKPMFAAAGLSGAPQTEEQLLSYAEKLTSGQNAGFITLNFDWLYWPLFRANGVEILTADKSKAAFNTPAAVAVLKNLTKLTKSGAIPGVAWTGRWAEPNGAFGAGGIGMHHAHTPALNSFMSQSDWANNDTVGIDTFPGGWSVPNYHGMGIVSTTKQADLAWEFIKIVTNDKWAENLVRVLGPLSGNAAADRAVINDAQFAKEQPLVVKMFETQLSPKLKLTGLTNIAEDAQVKDAVYRNLQKAIFGEVSAEKALADAEKAVNDILSK
jgi:ABC-type glycerol-3-phosphate transport system substrate-binding protein